MYISVHTIEIVKFKYEFDYIISIKLRGKLWYFCDDITKIIQLQSSEKRNFRRISMLNCQITATFVFFYDTKSEFVSGNSYREDIHCGKNEHEKETTNNLTTK